MALTLSDRSVVRPLRLAAQLLGLVLLAVVVARGCYTVGPALVLVAPAALVFLALAVLRPSYAVGLASGAVVLEGFAVPLGGAGLSPAEILFVFVAIGWICRALVGDERTRYPQILDYPIVVLILTLLPGLAVGAVTFDVVKLFVMWIAFFLSYLTVKAMSPTELRRVLVLLGLGAAVVAAFGVRAYISGGGTTVYGSGADISGRAAFGIDDPNYFAAYVCLGMVPLVALILGGQLRRWWVPCSIAVAIAFAGVVLSLSRGALLGLGISLMIVVMAWSRTRIITFGLGLVLIASIVVNANPLVSGQTTEVVRQRLASITVTDSDNNRLIIWRNALDIIQEHPWTGIGALQFSTVAEQRGITERGSPLENVHNVYLNLATELGVFALLAYLAWLLRIFIDVLEEWRRRRASTFAISVGAGAALAGYSFQALTLSQYRVQSIFATFFVMAGVAAAAHAWPDGDDEARAAQDVDRPWRRTQLT